MEETYFKKLMIIVLLGILFILSYLLLKPILLSIVFGVILAFIFTPVYKIFLKKIKNKNITSLIICILLFLIILLPIIFLTPVLIEQSVKLYVASQQLDFITPFKNIFPSLFISEEFSISLANTVHSFIIKATNSLMNSLADVILNLPTIILELIVIFFVFFYTLRDREEIIKYIKSILPFSSEIEERLFKTSRDVTSSIIYGMIIVGTLQGIITGIGFFIFGVSNPLLLSLFAIIAGIIPIIGPAIVWVPVMIYMLVAGNASAAIGIILFGLLSHIPDYLVRPFFLSKRTKIHTAVALIGMVAGVLVFGVLGIILGPLILSYLIIVLDLFKKRNLI